MKNNLTISQKRRIKPGGLNGSSSALNRWGISALEASLCAVVFIGCILVHFVQVYTRLGLPIEAGLSLISFATPISGLLYLSATQVIPDPPGAPLPTAQMALLGFLLWQLVRGKVGAVFSSGRPLLMTVAPFFVWNAGWSFVHGDYGHLGILLVFAILTGCAAAALVQQSGRRVEACLVAFLAGQTLAMCLFWIMKLKLGTFVEAFNVERYGSSLTDGARIGTARGNSTMLGTPMALVLVGVCVLYFARQIKSPAKKWITWLIGLVWVAAVVPPLLASGSRGAIVSAACGIVILLIIAVIKSWSLRNLPLFAAVATVIIILGWQRWQLGDQWQAMKERQNDQQSERGSVYAGRQLEWQAAWNGILDSPIIGGGRVELLSFSGIEDLWQSHSTYLDAGLAGGFPGMALFIWFVLRPIGFLWNQKRVTGAAYLLVVYATAVILIGYGSAIQAKFLWILWGIATAYFVANPKQLKRVRRPARKQQEAVPAAV